MSDERDTFLKMIEENPTDYTHRYVYADWLDEHGEHEEADRQRKFEASNKWLHDFAMKHSGEYFGYVITEEEMKEDPSYKEDYEKIGNVYVMKEEEENFYEGNPFLELMYFLNSHDEKENDFFLPFDTPYGFDDYSEELWEHYEVVTGKKSPTGQFRKEMPPFRCAC